MLLLYRLTLTSVHTYDALSYILDVDRKPWAELFHPHHLAYGPLGALIRHTALALGWVGSAERLLQAANALAGALGVALFSGLCAWSVPAGSLKRPLAAGLGGLLLGSGYAYWYYAVEVEVYTIAALLLIAALWLMLALARRPSLQLAAALGLLQGLAVLFHQTNVLLSGPASLALLLGVANTQPARPPWRDPAALRRLGWLAIAYALPLALVVGGAYLGVGLLVSGFRTWGDLSAWAAGYTRSGFWGGPVDATNLVLLGQGLAQSLAQPGGGLIGIVMLVTLLLSLGGLRRAAPGAVAIILSWLVLYGAFFFWWEPENIEFWIASMPPLLLLLILAACGLSAVPRTFACGTLLACGLLMLGLNWTSIRTRGDARLDQQRRVAAWLAADSATGDLLIAPDDIVELYLPFYEGRNQVISLSQALGNTHGDWQAACALMQARIEAALAGGYAVRIADGALQPTPAPPGTPATPIERYGLSPASVAACYAPFADMFTPVAAPDAAALPGYVAIPNAQSLAQAAGWDFTRGQWGWQAVNALPATSSLPGWALQPLTDPALSSPPLQLEAADYSAIELRMAAATANREAQIFWLDPNGQVDETRSLRWKLIPSGDPHTYQLVLDGLPGWEGLVTGLRLDPVSVGDGSMVVVESLRLLPRPTPSR